MTRWCSAPWCATTRISIRRSASSREASAPTSRSASTPISTARASSPIWRYTYAPTKCSPGCAATRAARPLPDHFEHVFGLPLDHAWDEWIAWEHEFQRANLAAIRKHPFTPQPQLSRSALGSVSRVLLRRGDAACSSAASAIPASSTTSASWHARRQVRRLADIKGAMLYRVTSLAYDPVERHGLVHHGQLRLPRPDGDRRAHRRDAHAARDARIGDIAFNPRRPLAWGVRHLNGFVTLVRIPTLREWKTSPSRTATCRSISTFRRTARCSRPRSARSTANRTCRCSHAAGSSPARRDAAVASFDFGHSTPEGFVFSPDGRYLYGSAYYTGVSNIYRFEIATGNGCRVNNADTGFFRPIPHEDGSLIVSITPAKASARDHPADVASPTRTRSASSAPRCAEPPD